MNFKFGQLHATAFLAVSLAYFPAMVEAKGIFSNKCDSYTQDACQPPQQCGYAPESYGYKFSESNNSSNCCPSNCQQAYNPPAYLMCHQCAKPSGDWVFDIEFLWWKSNVDGIALGEENLMNTSGGTFGQIESFIFNDKVKVKKPEFHFDPGVRLAIRNNSLCGCWDLGLEWTHYHTSANVHGYTTIGITGPVQYFTSYWENFRLINNISPTNPTYSKGSYTLNLDLLDLVVGRKFYVSSCFALRPFGGLRAADINQSYKVNSEFVIVDGLDLLTPSPSFTSKVDSKCKILAIGPIVGFDVDVHLGKNFAIVGSAAGSLVYGKNDRHSFENINAIRYQINPGVEAPIKPTLETDLAYSSKENANYSIKGITDLSIGLRWEDCIEWCKGVHPISVALLWEHHGFYNCADFNFDSPPAVFGVSSPKAVNNIEAVQGGVLFTTNPPSKRGDIFTQGLTFSANVGF